MADDGPRCELLYPENTYTHEGGRIIAGRVIARATIRGSKSNLRRACEGDEVEGRGGEREGEG